MEKARIVLITQEKSKRALYFANAADELGIKCVLYYDFDTYWRERISGDILKIDPPDITRYGVETLGLFTEDYIKQLKRLETDKTLRFLNSPAATVLCLDKFATKKALLQAGISTPKPLVPAPQGFAALLAAMEAEGYPRVFIKPRFGGGAAGVCAFAFSPKQKKVVLYTSLARKNGQWINSKTVKKHTDIDFCREAIGFVLSLDAIIEAWIPKPKVAGRAFDFRVVWQLGQIEAIVPRGAKSPITNLHLNDMALPRDLVAPWIDPVALEKICRRAVAEISGLSSAGLDILWTEGGYQVIEINSQGDLIYQDIYENNQIYKNQLAYLAGLISQT